MNNYLTLSSSLVESYGISDADVALKKYLAYYFKLSSSDIINRTQTLNKKLDIFKDLDKEDLLTPVMCFALGQGITGNSTVTTAEIVKDNDDESHIVFTNPVNMYNSTGTDYNPENIYPLKYEKFVIKNIGIENNYFHRKLCYVNSVKYYSYYTKILDVSPFNLTNDSSGEIEKVLQLSGSFARDNIKAKTPEGELLVNTSGKFGELVIYIGLKKTMHTGMIINGMPITYSEIIKTVPIYRLEFPYLLYDSFNTDTIKFTLNLNIGKSNF